MGIRVKRNETISVEGKRFSFDVDEEAKEIKFWNRSGGCYELEIIRLWDLPELVDMINRLAEELGVRSANCRKE
ncbi:MAG: hypothetical protein PHQ43_15425 [Dehalococcoidales bacterium]|nr:hypothetical protein [Dehalococcoidales bacterium]